MRFSSLPVFLMLGACAVEQHNTFQSYDPDAVQDMEPATAKVNADAVKVIGPWTSDTTKVITALAGPQSGRWMWPGEQPGLASGDAACMALGSDHVCDEDELRQAEAAGDLSEMALDVRIWVNMNNVPAHANCRGFTYDTADRGWGGGARTVKQGPGVVWEYVKHADAGFDAECLKDAAMCARTMPSDGGCNEPRYIPCCG